MIYEAAAQNFTEGLVPIDRHNRVLLWNRRVEELFGLPPD